MIIFFPECISRGWQPSLLRHTRLLTEGVDLFRIDTNWESTHRHYLAIVIDTDLGGFTAKDTRAR